MGKSALSSGISGATAGAAAGAPGGVVGAGIGAGIGFLVGAVGGSFIDSKLAKRNKKIRGRLGDTQKRLSSRIPEILKYYANLERQSIQEDEIKTQSGINQFLDSSNALFNQGQQQTSSANLAHSGSMVKDIQGQFDSVFGSYETTRDLQDLSAKRDLQGVGLAKDESLNKVSDLIESLEIDKLKYS